MNTKVKRTKNTFKKRKQILASKELNSTLDHNNNDYEASKEVGVNCLYTNKNDSFMNSEEDDRPENEFDQDKKKKNSGGILSRVSKQTRRSIAKTIPKQRRRKHVSSKDEIGCEEDSEGDNDSQGDAPNHDPFPKQLRRRLSRDAKQTTKKKPTTKKQARNHTDEDSVSESSDMGIPSDTTDSAWESPVKNKRRNNFKKPVWVARLVQKVEPAHVVDRKHGHTQMIVPKQLNTRDSKSDKDMNKDSKLATTSDSNNRDTNINTSGLAHLYSVSVVKQETKVGAQHEQEDDINNNTQEFNEVNQENYEDIPLYIPSSQFLSNGTIHERTVVCELNPEQCEKMDFSGGGAVGRFEVDEEDTSELIEVERSNTK